MVGHLGTEELAALAIAGDADHRRLHAVQLPHLRHHRAGGPAPGRRRAQGGGGDRRAGAVAVDRDRPWPHGAARRPGRAARGPDGRRRAHGRPGRALPADRRARAALRADRAGRAGLPARGVRPAHAAGDRGGGERGQRAAEPAVHLRLRLGAGGLGLGHRGGAGGHGRGLHALAAGRPGPEPASEPGRHAPAGAHRRRDLRAHRRAVRVVPGGRRGARARGGGLARPPT